jgi:hypothetical protein
VLYVVYSYKEWDGETWIPHNTFQYVKKEAPQKIADLEEIVDVLIDHHKGVEQITILNWKELEDS